MLSMLLAIALAAPQSVPSAQDQAFRAEALDRLERCGVNRERVTLAYEAELQSWVATIAAEATALDKGQYRCVADVEVWLGSIVFSGQEPGTGYRQALDQIGRERSRAWLEGKRLLAGLPRFDPARQTLADYARSLEAHCGITGRIVLQVLDDKHLLYDLGQSDSLDDRQLGCILNAPTAANLDEQGIRAGFLGLETAP